MKWISSGSKANTVILVVFLIAWLYTEITEYQERHEIYMEFKTFQSKGGRFTEQDGEDMQARLDHLEEHIDELSQD